MRVRKIIYIPAWHVAAEMGDEGASAALAGYDIKDIRERGIAYWEWVKELLEEEPLDIPKTRVYSESAMLPEQEMRPIFQKMADRGSLHSQIVLDLLHRGAKYEVIEDLELNIKRSRVGDIQEKTSNKLQLLWERYQKEPSKELDQSLSHFWDRRVKFSSISHELTTSDDKDIASHINQSLQEGETGILILGADHRVSSWLDQDIIFQPLREKLVELTNGDSGKNEVNPSTEKEIRTSGEFEIKH